MNNIDNNINRTSKIEVVGLNNNGILFSVNNHLQYNKSYKNIILINGSQFDHYNHNGKLIFNPFSIEESFYGHYGDFYNKDFKLYIYKYIVDNDNDNVIEFAYSLIRLLELLNSNQNIIMGQSYGGVIGCVASPSDLIKGVYAANPPIMGSPLSNLDLLKKNIKNPADLFLYIICSIILEPGKGFTIDDYLGVDIPINDKIHIFGGAINDLIPNNIMEHIMHLGAKKIKQLSGKNGDGMTIFVEDYLKQLGLDVIVMENAYHHNLKNAHYKKIIYDKMKKEN